MLPFACPSPETRASGRTDLLDERGVTSTERLNRLASPLLGGPPLRVSVKRLPLLSLEVVEPRTRTVVTPMGKWEEGRGGRRSVIGEDCVGFHQRSAPPQIFRRRPSHCESTVLQITVLPLTMLLASQELLQTIGSRKHLSCVVVER